MPAPLLLHRRRVFFSSNNETILLVSHFEMICWQNCQDYQLIHLVLLDIKPGMYQRVGKLDII